LRVVTKLFSRGHGKRNSPGGIGQWEKFSSKEATKKM